MSLHLRRLLCLLLKGGHTFRMRWQVTKFSLVCESCSYESPGWEGIGNVPPRKE